MNWQQIISFVIVGVTAVLLVRSQIRKRKRAKLNSCGNDCGCSATTTKKHATFEV